MKYFESFTSTKIIELIKSTKLSLFICLPSIHPEIVAAIIELKEDNRNGIFAVKINILVDFEPQTFRDGYGDFDSLEKLIQGEDNVKHLKDNRISFIISDDIGYFLFTESRLIKSSDNKTTNAVKIDPINIVRLKKHFFGGVESINFEAELKDATNQERKQLENPIAILLEESASVSKIDEDKLKLVSDNLKENPPLNPDFKRIVDVYSAKFQYVTLKFEGSNLQHRKINIPSKALPIMDAELKEKMETKLNLFDKKDEQNSFEPLIDYKEKIKNLREKYLTKIKSREESLLDKKRKSEFVEEINELETKIKDIKSEIIEKIAIQINQSRKTLENDLVNFLIANPKSLFPKHPSLWENNDNYLKQTAKDRAEKIISKIAWPEAHILVDDFKLSAHYSDITFEDLKDPEFINELVEAKLIDEEDQNSLAKFGKAVEVSLKKQNT